MRDGVDRGLAELRRDLVEALLALLQVVLEDVADRRHDGARVLQERLGDGGAAPAAAEQAEADGRVGLRAEDVLGFRMVKPAVAAAATPTNSRRPTLVSL